MKLGGLPMYGWFLLDIDENILKLIVVIVGTILRTY